MKIYTTFIIGYGYPAPKTPEGKLTTMLLYILGVPVTFIAVMDIVEIIFICERFIGLKIHNNTVQFREKLRLFLLKICFWCKETPDESMETNNPPNSGWRRRQMRKKRIRKRRRRGYWKIRTEERKILMKAHGHVMEETDTDEAEVPPSARAPLPKSRKRKRGRRRRKPKAKYCTGDHEKAEDTTRTTDSECEIRDPTTRVQNIRENEACTDDDRRERQTDSDGLKKSCAKSTPEETDVEKNGSCDKLPFTRTKTAKLVYVNETVPKRKLSAKSSKTCGGRVGFGPPSESILDNENGSGSREKLHHSPREFSSDSQIYEKPSGKADNLEMTYGLPGNYNECNNKDQTRSWHYGPSRQDRSNRPEGSPASGQMPQNTDCVIQIDDDDEQKLDQKQGPTSYSDSNLYASPQQDAPSWRMPFNAGCLAREIRRSASDLPSVHKPIQPLLQGSAARFDFHSSSNDMDQAWQYGSALDTRDVESGLELGYDWFVKTILILSVPVIALNLFLKD